MATTAAGAATSKRVHYQVTFAVLALAAMSYSLLQSLVVPALPSLEHSLQASADAVAWLLTGYLLSAVICTPILEMASRHSEALVHDVMAHATPAEGIFEFMRRCVGLAPSLRALVSRSPQLAETHRTMVDKLAPSINRLLANAKAAGSIRSDVTFSDIAVILMSVRLVEDRCGEHGASDKLGRRQQGERHLQLLVDGLRAKDSTLPHRPLTRAQLDELLVRE